MQREEGTKRGMRTTYRFIIRVLRFRIYPKILQNIFLRISLRSIIVCKSVCKTWHDLTSDPEIAKLHFDESCHRLSPLILAADSTSRSQMLYLAQPEKDDHHFNSLRTKFELPTCGLYDIANSCNGLLCLSVPAQKLVVICNPVTGEYVNLRDDSCRDYFNVNYGLGFSLVSNRYKVVKITSGGEGNWAQGATAQVLTVGTETWRDVSFNHYFFKTGCPTYLNGFIYWQYNRRDTLYLISFDFENECFGVEAGPEMEPWLCRYPYLSLGLLAGKLCICLITEFGTLHVWERSAKNAWYRVFSIDIHLPQLQCCSSLIPLKCLSDGSLMFYCNENAFLHIDPEKSRYHYFKIKMKKMNYRGSVAHIPSLVSLKHSLLGHNVQVLNLQSWKSQNSEQSLKVADSCIHRENDLGDIYTKLVTLD